MTTYFYNLCTGIEEHLLQIYKPNIIKLENFISRNSSHWYHRAN